MKCPHCVTEFFPAWSFVDIIRDIDSQQRAEYALWRTRSAVCPACGRASIYLGAGAHNNSNHLFGEPVLVRPKGAVRPPLSGDVPNDFAADYKEAVLVFGDSPKASAALSRRCLQHLIRQKIGISERDLATEIQKLIDSKNLPSHLAEAIDGVRNIGNFAAHPIKSTSTGEIVDVEPGEAEWLLDTLEGMFDFYFVAPAVLKRKQDALNKKLADAGKPPMK
jgi:hypothetical protein